MMKFRWNLLLLLLLCAALRPSVFADPDLFSHPLLASDEPVPHLYSAEDESFTDAPSEKSAVCPPSLEGYTVNFEDIQVVELIQFISKISGINFIFDKQDLNFQVTIVSQDPTSVEDLTASLLQILKMNGLSVVEQGNNVLIYKNDQLSKLSTVITDKNLEESCDSAIITRVFRLFNVDVSKISAIVRPLLSADAVVEVSPETRHLIVSDLTANVDKVADLLRALDTPDSSFDVAEYIVKSAYPTALVAYAKEILAPLIQDNPMQMIAQPSSNKIFIVSTPYLIHKALQILASLDAADITEALDLPAGDIANNVFYVYKLRYQNGQEIAAALHEIGTNLQQGGVVNPDLINTIYSIQWLQVNNSIVVSGTRESVDKVIQLILDLDEAPKQVYIEVLIIETTLQNSLDFGVQWIALGDEQDKLAYGSGLLSNTPPNPVLQGGPTTNPGARFVAANPPMTPPTIPNPGSDVALPVPAQLAGITALSDSTSAFGLGVIGNIIRHNGTSFLTLGALISALEQESDTSIVLNPRIMVEDAQPALFFVGQNIPYQTTNTIVFQSNTITQNIQYEDIGVQLRVTPNIAPNNIVTLDIDQTIAENLSPGSLTPTTEKILSTTRVHVPDNSFLVMSGHIRDKQTTIHSGIPCLGSLPLIGPAFARNIEQREKLNLIMFIRPRVVTNPREGVDLTNDEGYEYNWDSNPCSIIEESTERAPECQPYPPCNYTQDRPYSPKMIRLN